ncbi:MAG: cytochrome c [Thermoanaerobaculaceae bacterium]|jgi:hypothetical protein|nr:cytochrome c [Thermoanaerobaculaceae bacterium]
MKSLLWIGVVGCLVLVGVAMAADKPADGRELYKEYCKSCHGPNSPHGEVTPMSLIVEQWERFFAEKLEPSHRSVLDPKHDNRPVLEVITPEMLKKIKEFAIEHAADSEHPMTCG